MTTFNDRKQALFDCLRQAEKQVTDKLSMPPPVKPVHNAVQNIRKMRHETKHYRGQKSMYLKTEEPSPNKNSRRITNRPKDLDKWTYYNLENVPEITDRSNAEAAADCIAKILMDKQSQQKLDQLEFDDIEFRIKFSRPVKKMEVNAGVPEQVEKKEKLFVNSKIILPEYVVGEKSSSNNKPKKDFKVGESSKSSLKLDHLYHQDDEDAKDDEDVKDCEDDINK